MKKALVFVLIMFFSLNVCADLLVVKPRKIFPVFRKA